MGRVRRRTVLALFVVALGCGGGTKTVLLAPPAAEGPSVPTPVDAGAGGVTIKIVEEGTDLVNIHHDRAKPALRGIFRDLRDCYVAYLKLHGDGEGQVRFTIELRPDGTVASLNADADSSINDKTMLSCMTSAITALNFGATPNGGRATIEYALGFYPHE